MQVRGASIHKPACTCCVCESKLGIVWNRGLTADTDSRLRENGRKTRARNLGKRRDPSVTSKIVAKNKGRTYSRVTLTCKQCGKVWNTMRCYSFRKFCSSRCNYDHNIKDANERKIRKSEYNRKYAKEHKEVITINRRKSRMMHVNEIKLRRKIYNKSLRGRLSIKVAQYNRKLAKSDLSLAVVQRVYEENIKKYGTLTCELCFGPIRFKEDSLEHFHPISRKDEYSGNSINERSNLGVAHGINSHEKCNSRKQDRTMVEWAKYYKEVVHAGKQWPTSSQC